MKNLIALFFVSACVLSSYSQSIERQVIGSTGGSFTGSVNVDWTVGETVTATTSSGSTILTQGFQQPPAVANAVKTISNSSVNAYPNPTGNWLNIQWNGASFSGNLFLYDATGKVVWNASTSDTKLMTIDMSLYSAGLYNLKIVDKDQNASVIRVSRI